MVSMGYLDFQLESVRLTEQKELSDLDQFRLQEAQRSILAYVVEDGQGLEEVLWRGGRQPNRPTAYPRALHFAA